MEGDTKFKTSELLDCKHVENINFIHAKKERKKSHIQQEKPSHTQVGGTTEKHSPPRFHPW